MLIPVDIARALGQARVVEARHHGGAGAEVDADDICHKTDYETPARRTRENRPKSSSYGIKIGKSLEGDLGVSTLPA
jgi:hypothetical protein